MQVGTYPTRNFATLGTLVTPPFTPKGQTGWPDHFCPAPHVAMRVGLSHRRSRGAWRTVSEDPLGHFIPGFPADCPHRTDFHCPCRRPYVGPVTWTSTAGYSDVPAYSQVYPPPVGTNGYSYRRRLPGLWFRASPPKRLTPPLNLPAPGRRHSVYVVLRLSTLLCF